MADQTPPGSPPTATAAASALAPDPLTASILAKHATGQKLTPQEYGKLGAWKAKLGGWIPGRPKKTDSAAAPAGAPTPGPLPAAAPTAGNVPAAPVPDPRLVQRTTESILRTCENIARRKVAAEARKAHANAATLARFDAAVVLPDGPKELMVESSPAVAEALGLDARFAPLSAFLTGLSLWAGNIWLAIDELKALQAEQTPAPGPKSAAGLATPPNGGSSSPPVPPAAIPPAPIANAPA